MTNKKGFTLIEVLIVVAMIAALSGVVVNVINRRGQVDATKNSVVRTNLKKLEEGLHNFRIIEGYYPKDTNSDDNIMDEAGVATQISNWPNGTPEGALYSYRYVAGSPDGYAIDATRFDVGCLSFCSIDNEVFEHEESCAAIENSCSGGSTSLPICGDGDCNGSESCSTCSADCGTCAPVCGDGDCSASESCSSCSSDCGLCEDWDPPVLACPSGTKELTRLTDLVVTKGVATDTYEIVFDEPSRLYIVGYAGEGHPEQCPDGPLCYQCPDGGSCGVPPQQHESFTVIMEGPTEEAADETLGIYPDSGLNPGEGWFLIPNAPWETTRVYNANKVYEISVKATYANQTPTNESVFYDLLLCVDE